MAELADAHGSGPCGSNTMRVQVSFPARENLSRCTEVFVLQVLQGRLLVISRKQCYYKSSIK